LIKVFLHSTFTTNPDGTTSIKVANNNPVVVSFSYGYFIHANGTRCRRTCELNVSAHIQRVQIFHGAVMYPLYLGNTTHRHITTQVSYVHCETLGITRIFGQSIQVFYMHRCTRRALDPPTFELNIDAPPCDRQITHPQCFAIISGRTPMPTTRTEGCFFLRPKVMTRE
jgi:hypothetical protein